MNIARGAAFLSLAQMTFGPVRAIACLALGAAALAGCAPAASTVPGVEATASASDAAARLTALTDLDQRVARVAQRLSDANVELCPVVRLSVGWALHSARQYSLELRPLAESRFGLEGDLPGVLAAPEASAAAAAGLERGDLILAVEGVPLSVGDGRAKAEYEGLAANIRVIDTALARGGTTALTVRRAGREREVRLQPRRSCGYEVQLDPSDELNARADGRRLFIASALAGFTRTDDELAVILGHELAHHVLGHRSWSDTGGAGRLPGARTESDDRASGNSERDADRVGLILAARAGYDAGAAAPFWRRFGASNWRVRYPQVGHASAEARARALEAVQADIEAKRAAGSPLLP